MINKKKASSILLASAALAGFLLVASLAHCAVEPRGASSIGNVVYQDNPLTYKAGDLVDLDSVSERQAINMTIQPLGTYALFRESILVCGDSVALLKGKHNPLLLVYKTAASRSVDGIGCHRLVGVYSIGGEK